VIGKKSIATGTLLALLGSYVAADESFHSEGFTDSGGFTDFSVSFTQTGAICLNEKKLRSDVLAFNLVAVASQAENNRLYANNKNTISLIVYNLELPARDCLFRENGVSLLQDATKQSLTNS